MGKLSYKTVFFSYFKDFYLISDKFEKSSFIQNLEKLTKQINFHLLFLLPLSVFNVIILNLKFY